MLRVLTVLPVITATNKRSLSISQRLKAYFRLTMSEDRLIDLTPLNLHRSVYVDVRSVIKKAED